MARSPRRDLIELTEVGVYHCVQRAVRRAWLSPVELPGEAAAESQPLARRASNQGFLPLKLEQDLELLDWTGRQARPDKRGQIPADLLPIL